MKMPKKLYVDITDWAHKASSEQPDSPWDQYDILMDAVTFGWNLRDSVEDKKKPKQKQKKGK